MVVPPAVAIGYLLYWRRTSERGAYWGIVGGYLAGKVKLHFLPPYCPDHNKIERVWKDLHANVTRNHRCRGINHLMREVRYYLNKRNRQTLRQRLAA